MLARDPLVEVHAVDAPRLLDVVATAKAHRRRRRGQRQRPVEVVEAPLVARIARDRVLKGTLHAFGRLEFLEQHAVRLEHALRVHLEGRAALQDLLPSAVLHLPLVQERRALVVEHGHPHLVLGRRQVHLEQRVADRLEGHVLDVQQREKAAARVRRLGADHVRHVRPHRLARPVGRCPVAHAVAQNHPVEVVLGRPHELARRAAAGGAPKARRRAARAADAADARAAVVARLAPAPPPPLEWTCS